VSVLHEVPRRIAVEDLFPWAPVPWFLLASITVVLIVGKELAVPEPIFLSAG